MKKWTDLLLLLLLTFLCGCGSRQTTITNLKMLEGGKVFAVPTGTVADQLVLKRFPDAKIKYFNTILDCALAVRDGKADAASYDLPVLKNLAAKYDEITVLSELLFDDKYGFAVRQEDRDLKKTADEVLKELQSEGTYAEMMERWFPEKGSPGPMPVIENNGKGGILRFGTAAVTEPMSYVGENRDIIGFDIEFASRIASRLDKKLEIVDMEFGAMIPALISGKVDMIGAGLSITEERAKKVLFTESYYPSGIAALVKRAPKREAKGTATKFRSENDIKDKTIGVLLGSVHDRYAKKNYHTARLFEYQTVSDMTLALVTGKIDVALFSDASMREILQKYDQIGILQKGIFTNELGTGFNKENSELRNQFNTFLREIKSNGIMDDMIERWVKKGITEMPSIEVSNKNGILKVGIDKTMGMPYALVENGELIGMDVELAKRFAASLGKEFVPVDLIFASMLASLRTGKIDMAACAMTITEERKKEINFSDPYFITGSSIMALKKNIETSPGIRFGNTEDIRDKKIGVLMGSIQDMFAKRDFPDARILQYQNVTDMLTAVKSNKVDVGFADHVGLKEIFDKNPELGLFAANLYVIPIAAAFNEERDELREKFNVFLKEIKANGVYDDMVSRWMDKGMTEMPIINIRGTNGILRNGIVSDIGLPFTVMQNGKLAGFDIELSMRFAESQGMTYEPVDIPFGSMIASLATNKIDFTTCSMMITEEREKQVDFSDPYYESGVSLFALKSNIQIPLSKKMAGAADIGGKKVGVLTGTVQDRFIAEKYPESEISRFDNATDLVTAVSSGKIDVAMMEQRSSRLILQNNPNLGVLADDLFGMPLGVGFSKSNPELRQQFNAFLSEIRKDGTYDKILGRWFQGDPEKAEMPFFGNVPSAKKLTVGTNVNFLPYVAVKNGEFTGFDIEMILTFARKYNYQAEFVIIPFPSLIPALESGKVDLIIDGIAITPERARKIDFSDPYTEFRTTAVAARKNLAAYQEVQEKPVRKSFLKSVSESFHNNIILEKRYLLIIDGLKLTILITIFAALVGTILGGLVCYMRMSGRRILSSAAKGYISLLRGTPVLVLLMIIYYVVFASVNINPSVVAVLAFGLNFGAYVSEMFRTSIESVDKGQQEAGIAGGFTRIQTFIFIIMPQALRRVLPVYKGEFISLLKMTSIVGYIAVQDLTKASDIIRSRTFDAFFPLIMAAVLYLTMAWLLSWGLERIEISVDPKRKKLTRLTATEK